MNKDELIIKNMPLVKYIASKYHTKKIGIEYEDLVSYGTIGLIDATKKFDESKGVKFSTFASMKITSAIIDEIRKNIPISRSYTAKTKEYNKAVDFLQNKLLRKPTKEEISKYMNISIKELETIIIKMQSLNMTSLDNTVYEDEKEIRLIDTLEDSKNLKPSEIVEKEELVNVMTQAIDMLKEKDKLVLSLYYYEQLTLKEIGGILGISESRVSQLNSRAIGKLREIMKKIKYIEGE